MAQWFFARTIIEKGDVEAEANRLAKKHPRFSEAYEALKWVLARSCDEVEYLSREVGGVEYCLYRQAGDAMAGTPDITVLYSFDDDQVVLIGLRAEKSEIPEE